MLVFADGVYKSIVILFNTILNGKTDVIINNEVNMEKIGVIIFDVNCVSNVVILLWHCTWVIYSVS